MTGEKEKGGGSLHWHVLGGNNKNQIGANSGMCVYSYTDADGTPRQKALLFDMGILMADPGNPEDPALAESDTVIPDLARFLYKAGDPSHRPEIPLDSIFLTHNHSDHTGGIPFLILMGYKLPKIYATPYTAKRLEQELSNAGLDPSEWPEIYAIAPGQPVAEGPVSVTAFSVSHSTPQSAGFFIETPEGNILHTGDFKLDQSVVWGPAFSEEQFRRIVSKPVDLLLLDSTGADNDVEPVTESDMRETLHGLLEEYPGKRFIIAVMGGYEENLASIAMVAAEKGRALWVAGGAHEQTLAAMQDTGMSITERLGRELNLRILGPGKPARDLAESKPKENIVVVTGAQGHNNTVLARAADGHHNALQLNPRTDVIVFCAPSIPGQEATRAKMLATLEAKGYTVLTPQDAALYPHAHARLPEIVEFVKLAEPKCVLPVHGSKELRGACGEAMGKMGKKVLQADNGDVLKVTRSGVASISPETKGAAPLVGFKTLQGASWNDRYYLMVSAPQKGTSPQQPAPANSNKKRRPRIFNLNRKP